jgi:hypothetical protein
MSYLVRVDMATHEEVKAGCFDAESRVVALVVSEVYGSLAARDQVAVELAVVLAMERSPREVMPTGVALLDFPVD